MILLGYLAHDQTCWLINPAALSDDDLVALREIAGSPAAQKTPNLASLLSCSGMIKEGTVTWWSWLMSLVDPVLVVPRIEIEIDPEQAEIFEKQEQQLADRPAFNERTAAMVAAIRRRLA
jgi:hypothetical protein